MGMSAPILVLIVSIANYVLGKLIVGEERGKISDTDGKYIYGFGLATLGIIAFGSLGYLGFSSIDDSSFMKWYWLCFVILILSFQSFMHWKYLKNSNKYAKEYMVYLIELFISIIYILIFMF